MARGHIAWQMHKGLAAGKDLRDMAKAALRIELIAVKRGDSHRLLPAMLQRVEAQRHHGGGIARADDAEDAAFLTQLVPVDVPGRAITLRGLSLGERGAGGRFDHAEGAAFQRRCGSFRRQRQGSCGKTPP